MALTDAHQLLVDEYMFLQRCIEEFEGRALTVKGWSVTLGSGAIAAAIQQDNPSIFLAAAASAAGFWLTEAIRKGQQRTFNQRVSTIEAYFRMAFPGTPPHSISPLQISTSWWQAHLRKRPPSGHWASNFLTPLVLPGVILPHVVLIAAALSLFWSWHQ